MPDDRPPTAVAYVMTHYPRVALSFLSGEIDEMEARGVIIQPFAMNLPDQADLLSEDSRARYAKTRYLKRNWGETLGAFASAAVRHPIAMAKLIGTAITSAHTAISNGRAAVSIPIILEFIIFLARKTGH